MEVMYWTFPHINGRWRVKAGDKNTLESIQVPDLYTLPVKRWDVKNTPVVAGRSLDTACDEYTGVRCEAPSRTTEADVWQTQEGGTHYTDMQIQPFQYSMANGLDPMQHTIVKYVSRFRAKNGVADLKKARQTLDLLIYWEEKNATRS